MFFHKGILFEYVVGVINIFIQVIQGGIGIHILKVIFIYHITVLKDRGGALCGIKFNKSVVIAFGKIIFQRR